MICLETKKCKFYIMVSDFSNTIDAWIENDKIYTTLYDDFSNTEHKPANYFTKDGGIYANPGAITNYCFYQNLFIPFEVDKKWGYGNPWSNEIFIPPIYDFAYPFDEYGVVCKGCSYEYAEEAFSSLDGSWIEGGKFGLINEKGKIMIPFEYDGLKPVVVKEQNYFIAVEYGKYGLLNANGEAVIPLKWYHLEAFRGIEESLFLCSLYTPGKPYHYGVYNADFELIVPAELTHKPTYCPVDRFTYNDSIPAWYDQEDYEKNLELSYFVLQKDWEYGVLCSNGELVSKMGLSNTEVYYCMKHLGRDW